MARLNQPVVIRKYMLRLTVSTPRLKLITPRKARTPLKPKLKAFQKMMKTLPQPQMPNPESTRPLSGKLSSSNLKRKPRLKRRKRKRRTIKSWLNKPKQQRKIMIRWNKKKLK
jgi:hypothetical protein